MNLNELMIKNENELTEKQQEFLTTHNNILTSGAVIGNGLISLAQNLKRMKDDELYKEVGYKTFDEYSEQACGLKQRQAYNYIKILESFDENFLHSNAKIGVSKLTLLSTLSTEEKQTIVETISVEDSSVNELKEEIKKLKSRLKNEKSNSSQEIDSLKKQIEELQKNSANDPKTKEKIEKLNEKIKNLTEDLKKSQISIEEYQVKIEDLKKQNIITSTPSLVEFKIKFDNLQDLVNDIVVLISRLPVEKREGCKSAVKEVVKVLC